MPSTSAPPRPQGLLVGGDADIAEMVDSAPMGNGMIGWASMLLLLPAESFHFTDSTGGQETYEPYTATTMYGLVRVEKVGQHVGTVKQSRWGLLAKQSLSCRGL